jgi:prepilin-type processing-associated H-X9-DG protein
MRWIPAGMPGANYLFLDGHAEMLPVERVYSRAAGVDLFNPGRAR